MGDNVFVATMDSEKDRDRTWDGFPWMINKHAAILMRLILRTPFLHLTSAVRYKIVSVAPNIILHLKISIDSSTIIYTASRIDIGSRTNIERTFQNLPNWREISLHTLIDHRRYTLIPEDTHENPR
jgi:hypothetical protein